MTEKIWQQAFVEQQGQRALVVKIAREWIGTPYQHGARIKKVACDCTFPAMVYEEAGLVKPIRISPYCSMAHLNRSSGQYLLQVKKIAKEVPIERAGPGDLVMFHIARDYSHSGIVSDQGWPWMIHADMRAGGVIEVPGDGGELVRASGRKFFSLW